jgi:hypothetical protein
MGNHIELEALINKLEERGVLSNQRAKALRRLAKLLGSPVGRVIRFLVIKAIAYIILDSIRDR